MFGKVVALEGKLMKHDFFVGLAYNTYNVLAFPFAYLTESLKLGGWVFLIYLINIFLWATLITYVSSKFK